MMLNVLKLTPSLNVCRQGVQSGTLLRRNLGKVESDAHSVRLEGVCPAKRLVYHGLQVALTTLYRAL